jgi:hypothetical protein
MSSNQLMELQFDRNRQVAIIWSIEDVQALDKNISDSEAMIILKRAENHHDAEIGINWEVLQYYVDEAA